MPNLEILAIKKTPHDWMNLAYKEAEKSFIKDEVPVGAIIVLDNNIIGRGHNQSILKNDSTAHAEIEAIRSASRNVKNYRLTRANLYVTLEPCAMCYGAIVHSRISNIYYGARDSKTGVCGSCDDFSQKEFFNHKPRITGQILERKCSDILKKFFLSKRY